MYKIFGLIFIFIEVFLFKAFGWTALIWGPLGYGIGLLITSQIALPIIIGFPIAISLVSKKEMRKGIFLGLLRTPLIWMTIIFIFNVILLFFFREAIFWLYDNLSLNLGLNFGTIAILLSPISKSVREDFRIDFNKAYGNYYTDYEDYKDNNFNFTKDKNQIKQIEAAIKISTNLYLHTVSNTEGILKFTLPDSRFRYLIFCMSGMVKSCEDNINDSKSLINECLHLLSIYTTSSNNNHEYFSGKINSKEAESNGFFYFQEDLKNWQIYFDTLKSGDKYEASKEICSMIHFAESDEPISQADIVRLEKLSNTIELFIPSMRRAFIDSI